MPPALKAWRTVRDVISDLPRPSRRRTEEEPRLTHFIIPGARSYTGHTGSALDQPAKTLKAGVHGVPGGENMLALPTGEVRYFTVRESARLQSFPDEFVFCDSWTESMRQIGKAVPVDLAELLARRLASMLDREKACPSSPTSKSTSSLLSGSSCLPRSTELDPEGLTVENLDLTPTGQGVYPLHRNGVLVYVGKAENLRNRLSQHRFKIMGRQNIDVAEMSFACVTIHPNWTAPAPESALIQHYAEVTPQRVERHNVRPARPRPQPGYNRHTRKGFDMQFPIRHEWPCEFVEERVEYQGAAHTHEGGIAVPPRIRVINKNYRARTCGRTTIRTVVCAQGGIGASQLLGLITQRIPGWQSTRFPGHMILYPESRDYVHGAIIHRQPA